MAKDEPPSRPVPNLPDPGREPEYRNKPLPPTPPRPSPTTK